MIYTWESLFSRNIAVSLNEYRYFIFNMSYVQYLVAFSGLLKTE